jgi:hypothetical protein
MKDINLLFHSLITRQQTTAGLLNYKQMKNIFFCLILLQAKAVIGQAHTPPPSSGLSSAATEYFSIRADANGNLVLPAERTDVEGNAFYKEQWTEATIVFTDGKTFANIKTRMNLFTGMVHCLLKDGKEVAVESKILKKIILNDSLPGILAAGTFQSGFPAVDDHTAETFYKVLEEGNCTFLKCMKKNIKEYKQFNSNSSEKKYELFEKWYLLKDGKINFIKKSKESLLKILADKKDSLEAFVKSNKLNCKSEDDIKKVIAYYNSL